MASYPSAVKTFTTKNALDTIQPSHINDLQDEIAAIESGLLNGTAPMNSSRITAPAAQVTNSTATNLTVTGTLTIASIADRPFVMVAADTEQQFASGTFYSPNWNREETDVFGMHSTSVNSSRLNLSAATGVWMVGAYLRFRTSTAYMVSQILLNDTIVIGGANYEQDQCITCMVRTTSTNDYVIARMKDFGSTNGMSTRSNLWARWMSS